jgi:hypothetical protein
MSCICCTHEFKENEGRFNHSDGMLCEECENNIDKLNLESNQTLFDKDSHISFSENEELGTYTVNGELLSKYANVTNHLKFFTTIALGKPDIFVINNILRKKELILRDLFVNVNLPFDLSGSDLEAHKFIELINEWAEGALKCSVK